MEVLERLRELEEQKQVAVSFFDCNIDEREY